MTEGSEADNHLTVEVIYGKLGQEVVAFIDTYDDSAKGICLVLILLYCMSCFINVYNAGGFDFEPIENHEVIFSPNNYTHKIPLNIYTDDLFEQKEIFTATLSTSHVRLQLKDNVESIVIKNTICHEEDGPRLFITSDNTTEIDEVDIKLGLVILTKTSEGIRFSLANSKSNRVNVGTSLTKVTIRDNNSKSIT